MSNQIQKSILSDSNQMLSTYQSSNGRILFGEKTYKQVASQPSFSGVLFGSNYVNMKVEANTDGDFLNDARLITKIGPMSKTGGTYVRGVNALAINMYDGFRLFSDSKESAYITSDMVFENIYKNVDSDKWARICLDIGYDVSTTNRNTLGTAPQTLVLPLKYMFNIFSKPLDISAFKKLEIRCYLKQNIQFCLQTDGTAPTFAFTDFYLDNEYIITDPSITNYSRNLLMSGKSPVNFDYEYIDLPFALASGVTVGDLDLPQLAGKNVVDICVVVRSSANLNTVLTSDYSDSNLPVASFNIKNGNKYINNLQQDIVINDYNRIVLPRLHFLGIKQIINRTNPAITISFSSDYSLSDVDRGQNYNGYRDFTGILNARLHLVFPSALAAASQANVFIRCIKLVTNSMGTINNV